MTDAALLEDADAPDASTTCEWRLGEPKRLTHSVWLSATPSTYGSEYIGMAAADSSAWVISHDFEGTWLHHLDANGDDIRTPSLVDPGPRNGMDLGADIVLGRSGGLVVYDGCPASGSCFFDPLAEMDTQRVPKLRAFDAHGVLGPVQFLDVPGSVNERLVGAGAGDSFLVAVANRVVQRVAADGSLLGPPEPSLFSSAPLAAFSVNASSAIFALAPRDDGSIWLAKLDTRGRSLGEIRTDASSGDGVSTNFAINRSGERIAIGADNHIDVITQDGSSLWTAEYDAREIIPIYTDDTLFLFLWTSSTSPWEVLHISHDGTSTEMINIGDLSFNPVAHLGLKRIASYGSGLLLFERVGTSPDPDRHFNVYPLQCLPSAARR